MLLSNKKLNIRLNVAKLKALKISTANKQANEGTKTTKVKTDNARPEKKKDKNHNYADN